MPLTITLGATVTATIDAHSATNGAPFPDGTTIALTSSDPTVATVPATLPPTSGSMSTVATPVTVLTTGSATISGVATAPDGTTFPASDTLLVGAVIPGMTHITLTLTSP